MRKLFEITNTKVFTENDKGELKQNERNQFRTDFMTSLVEFLEKNDIPAIQIKEGVAIEIPNETLGCITVVLSPTIKPIQFDTSVAHDEFVADIADKVAKAEKAQADKELKIATQKALKEKKA